MTLNKLSLGIFIPMRCFIVLLILLILLGQISVSHAANIFVTAPPGLVGCDLREAIESANTNSAIGGCAAGSSGQDTIQFFAGFTRYELPSIAFSNLAGSSGTPEITSEIRIIGPGTELLVIARPLSQSDIYRAFTVSVDGDLTLENLSLQNFGQSSGFSGGAIRVAGSLTLRNVEIADNSADFGGGLWVQGGSAVIRSSLIRNNRAGLQGGGIGLSSGSTVAVFDSTISNNRSDIGGGIALAAAPDSSLSLYNTTITENTASVRGGGLSLLMAAADTSNSVVIRNTIISGNTAASYDEAHFVNPGTGSGLDIRNSVVGNSANTYGQSVNILQFFFNDNIVLTQGSNSTPLRSIIGPLDANGGKTMTHALVANSPAIDNGLQGVLTGGPLIFFSTPGCRGEFISVGFGAEYRPDQRGVSRPIGNECDIGAYEYEPLYEPPEVACYVIKAKNNKVITFCL
ncbi:MAG: hypothetical protein ACJAYF_003853 [Arenicella sp.]|jgi:hypothetical protein